jgi:hypothetical protein
MAFVHARYNLVKNRERGVDPLVDVILAGENKSEVDLYARARIIYLSDIKRSYVESCLLASQDLNKISELLEIPAQVLISYKHFFFNIENFTKLDLLEIVDQAKTTEERGMKIWAMSQGLDFIAWRLGKTVKLNPVEGIQELFTLCVFKSKEALFSGNATEGSKEATKWAKLSMDLARILKAWVMDSGAAKKDIELALMSISPEFKGFDSLGDMGSGDFGLDLGIKL